MSYTQLRALAQATPSMMARMSSGFVLFLPLAFCCLFIYTAFSFNCSYHNIMLPQVAGEKSYWIVRLIQGNSVRWLQRLLARASICATRAKPGWRNGLLIEHRRKSHKRQCSTEGPFFFVCAQQKSADKQTSRQYECAPSPLSKTNQAPSLLSLPHVQTDDAPHVKRREKLAELAEALDEVQKCLELGANLGAYAFLQVCCKNSGAIRENGGGKGRSQVKQRHTAPFAYTPVLLVALALVTTIYMIFNCRPQTRRRRRLTSALVASWSSTAARHCRT